ncbi:MAG TPA: SDR family NAD(P)-dependent oxidoreductase [Myxococcota bacterium]
MKPDLSSARGRSFLVTGGNTGIGKATVEALAAAGGRVLVAGRSKDKTQPVLDAIKAKHASADLAFVALDLGSFASIKDAAKQILDDDRPIDVLINNAGLAGSRGLTVDGLERTIGTNHFGTYLFTQLLLPKVLASSAPRVVNVASEAHYNPKTIDFDAIRTSTSGPTGFAEYGVSKLMNVLHAKALARAHPSLTAVSLHPGVVASDVWRAVPTPFRQLIMLFMLSTEEGAYTQLHCATANDLVSSGYYDKSRLKRPSRLADDVALQDKLMAVSREVTGV